MYQYSHSIFPWNMIVHALFASRDNQHMSRDYIEWARLVFYSLYLAIKKSGVGPCLSYFKHFSAWYLYKLFDNIIFYWLIEGISSPLRKMMSYSTSKVFNYVRFNRLCCFCVNKSWSSITFFFVWHKREVPNLNPI